MHRLNELVEKLTPNQVKEVEDFAEFLVSRNRVSLPAAADTTPGKRISFEGWAGCMAHVEPDKSNKQLLRAAWDELAAKHD